MPPQTTSSIIVRHRRDIGLARTLATMGFLAVALQRFALGASSVQLTTLTMLATVCILLIGARLRLSATNVILASALILSAYLSSLFAPSPGSITSLFLLLGSYTLVLFRGHGDIKLSLGQHLFSGAVCAIKFGALLGLLQYAAQKFGLGFLDPFQRIGSQWLVQGFNSYYDLEFAGGRRGEFKPNGMIFLEPSFLSLFSAIALVYVLCKIFEHHIDDEKLTKSTRELRSNIAWGVILTSAIAASSSTSGLVVLGVALVPLVFSVKRNRALLLIAAISISTAAASGFFAELIGKANEGFSGNTSTALRLSRPYELLTPYWLERPLFGWGPGTASEAINQIAVPGLQASTAMKALVEYGIFGTLVIALIVLSALLSSSAPLALRAGLLAAWLIPADNLLNSTLVVLLLLAVPNWGPSAAASYAETDQGSYTERSARSASKRGSKGY